MHAHHKTETEAARRIVREFHELPGLQLTVWQAARLWSLDHGECEAVLDALVGSGVLRRRGSHYVRSESADAPRGPGSLRPSA